LRSRCVVLGGGGHAKMVVETLLAEGKHRAVGVTDPKPPLEILGVPIPGDDQVLLELRKRGVRTFAVGLGDLPDNRPRVVLFRTGIAAGLKPVSLTPMEAGGLRSAS
jgi:UDP-perosamine 4-acetyltransferase